MIAGTGLSREGLNRGASKRDRDVQPRLVHQRKEERNIASTFIHKESKLRRYLPEVIVVILLKCSDGILPE